MGDIADTGERILLEKETPLMIARHFCAYKFAKDYAAGKTVLDIGCGEGYGSLYLSGFAQEVVGIDYDQGVIEYAKAKYQKNNLRFFTLNANALDSLKDKFDIICSFQCIEHIKEAENFLRSIRGLLKDKGIFICSTPNRKDASPGRVTPVNKFHVKEYLQDEFKALLEEYFKNLDMFGLKRGRSLNFYRRLKKAGLCNFLPEAINPVKRFYGRIDCNNFIMVKGRK